MPERAPPDRAWLTVAIALIIGCACSEAPLEFADWIIEVPEGTPVYEYAPVPMDERDRDAVRLIEELVIGSNPSSPDEGVFRPVLIAATVDGTIFVADGATSRVQMYDREGRFVKSLGREGQGPGEFDNFWGMTIAGDVLVIDDNGNDRFSLWSLDGEHIRDHVKETPKARSSRIEGGLDDGTFVARTTIFTGDDGTEKLELVARFSADGAELARIDEMVPAPPVIPDRSWTPIDMANALISLFDDPRRQVAVGATGLVVVSPVQQYQVAAFRPDGTPAWALRVAWPRPPVSSQVKRVALQQLFGDDSPLDVEDVAWPPDYSAIDQLLTDGSGRVYVIPQTGFQGEPPPEVPVDVFSAEGALVAAGVLPARWRDYPAGVRPPWTFAAGHHVYGFAEDEAGETVAVRYRLVVTER